MERELSKAAIISLLTQSPHASSKKDERPASEKLRDAYFTPLADPARQDPEFFAHLIAWNHMRGEVRDAKAALPIIALKMSPYVGFRDNALAHLADLNPKLLVKALDFSKTVQGPKNIVHRFVKRYLRDLEADRREFETVAVQHRISLRRLYTLYHIDAAPFARSAVVEARSVEGKFGIVKQLPTMSPIEIVAAVQKHKLPWLVVRGALGSRAKEPDVLMALMSRMTAADLATSSKWLVRAGVKDHPQTRAAFEELLQKAVKPKRARGTTLKTQKAVKALEDIGEEKIAGKLQAVQDKQVEQLRTIEGNWAVFGDKSGSMQFAIAAARRIASVLTKCVKGDVHLLYFDNLPRYVGNVKGQSLEEIEMKTRFITGEGGTSMGSAMRYLYEHNIIVDGIAIVSDGGERHPPLFSMEYQRYCQKFNVEPTVYLYEVQGQDPNFLGTHCHAANIDLQVFDLRRGVDDYSLPNVVQTMRIGRYSLLDEIMSYKLRTLDEALARTTGMHVLPKVRAVKV